MNELMEAGMSPHLACHRPDESWRIERLQQIARRCPKNVIGLHDHKGLLSVNWLTPPTIRELTEVVLAWASQNEREIDHYLLGAELDVQTIGYDPFTEKVE
jgi:hypothetical protein